MAKKKKIIHSNTFHQTIFCFNYGFNYIHCDIIPISLCKVTTFISFHSRVNFSPGSCVGPMRKVFSGTFQRFSMRSRGWTLWWPICVWKTRSYDPWTTLSHFEPNGSWHFHGICLCHQERKQNLMIEKPDHSVHSGHIMLLNLDLTRWGENIKLAEYIWKKN